MKSRLWLVFALITTVFWGVWGAFIEIPDRAGFPATLSYVVWSLTTIPCALVALRIVRWRLERGRRSALLGLTVGLLGAGGQILLFLALRLGPAYLVFPIVSLYPAVSVILSVTLLKEHAGRRAWTGIALAFPAMVMLSWQPPGNSAAAGAGWVLLALAVFLMWGVQGYFMKFATQSMRAESVFFYMMSASLMLIPAAAMMTDFSKPIEWGFRGPYLAAMIQTLNSIGALCFVYAVRYGKAIIVVPMTALAPVLTIILSLLLYRVIPHPVVLTGMGVAVLAIYLMAE